MQPNSPLKILAADDEELNLMIIARLLDEAGYGMIEAADGMEAWEYLTEHPREANILMLDRMMPGMNGFDLSRKVRTIPHMRFIPIIIQSGKIEEDTMTVTYNAGADYYLLKPFEHKFMQDMVRAVSYDVTRHKLLMDFMKNPLPFERSATTTYKTPEEACKLAASLAIGAVDEVGVAEALSELMLNAIEHGNLGIDIETKRKLILAGTLQDEIAARLTQPEFKDRKVTVKVEPGSVQQIITITDEGAGFDWEKFTPYDVANLTKLCGRGIDRATRLLSKVEFLGNGNAVRCAFNLPRPS